MKSALTLLAALAAMSALAELHASPGPLAGAPTASIAVPKDRPFAGQIELSVDATDVSRRIIHVHESVSGLSGETLLLYPKWLPGTHAPEGPLDRLAGIKISVNGL